MATEVTVINREWYTLLHKPKISTKAVVGFTLEELKIAQYKPVLSVVLANDNLLWELNKKYRNIDRPTNVLSFSYHDTLSHGVCLGEVFLSIERLKSESYEMEVDISAHFAHMLIHGILHILGYDHETSDDEQKMQTLEVELLGKLGIANPYLVKAHTTAASGSP
ncbi:rRNA maturation RNase YbeY [Candidatus Anaplasma sp. TIGMIC]|uniref:rRNA maturation RNase YbeY n=1 Tax=Candidatus Anaplasma sp. TIGMIC TaxID=3020713 RepID=UPI00232C2D33|nr:rRNA maturation RNase YbeY [Candidatus Anaplasma sp. TIGMIC]MDB1135515.1 rRNA maturation RNase YbeY [Candidatus Anaplasma sp. TIGMIC]